MKMKAAQDLRSQADASTPRASCRTHEVLACLGDRWTILVLTQMARSPEGRLRFSQIKRGTEGISQRMLTLTLRNAERNGLVVRRYFAEVPPRVEYELSDLGRSMQTPLEAFSGWIRANWPQIEAARLVFDGLAADSSG